MFAWLLAIERAAMSIHITTFHRIDFSSGISNIGKFYHKLKKKIKLVSIVVMFCTSKMKYGND